MTPNQKEAYDHMQKALEKLLPMARKHGTLFGSINPWTEACDIVDAALTVVKNVQNEQAQSVEPVARVESIMANGRPFISRLPGARLKEGDSLYLHPPQPQATTPAGEISESVIDEFLEDYEMIGESEDGLEGCYVPDENDKALIKDAFFGLLEHVSTLAAQGEKP